MKHSTKSDRVAVAVSKSMVQLRQMQGILNGFWQTSELAYGYVLSHADFLASDTDRPTVDVLGHIESQVWFPNNQGRIKREVTIGNTLKQIRQNTTYAYCATLLSFCAAFEAYLDTRITRLKRAGNSWGPFVQSLSISELREAACPLPLRVVLCADFSRRIRNNLTHAGRPIPKSLSDQEVKDWKASFHKGANQSHWPEGKISAAIEYAAYQVIGQAADRVNKEKANGRDLPFEYFYMLFNFTNLDNLAFAIEEALQPRVRPSSTDYVYRRLSDIRRHDLIIEPKQA
jgi:hypothetical protein